MRPALRRMRSVSVVLPASTCAMMPILRSLRFMVSPIDRPHPAQLAAGSEEPVLRRRSGRANAVCDAHDYAIATARHKAAGWSSFLDETEAGLKRRASA